MRMYYDRHSNLIRGDSMKRAEINNLVRSFAKASDLKAYWQIINTVIPYLGFIYLMFFLINKGVHYSLVIPISIIPALFLVRIFIFFHDCTHKSFMKSKKEMNIFGHIFGILVFTPFHQWQREHNEHHRTVGNIDKRGTGDVWTLTVDEYRASSWVKRLGYRLYRNPIFLFIIGPAYIFLINQRLPISTRTKKDWMSLIITNIGVLLIILVVSFTVGFKYYLMIQLPIIMIASSLGVWLFFVQHQYEEVYWEGNKNWDITDAALKGSSVYRLPLIINWFTGSIGYHNIHHLNARIPNYKLKKLYKSTKEFQTSKEIKLFESIKLAKLYLYDERNKRLISRRRYKKLHS